MYALLNLLIGWPDIVIIDTFDVFCDVCCSVHLLKVRAAASLTCTAAAGVLWNSLRKTAETAFWHTNTAPYQPHNSHLNIIIVICCYYVIFPHKYLPRAQETPQRRHVSLSSVWRQDCHASSFDQSQSALQNQNRKQSDSSQSVSLNHGRAEVAVRLSLGVQGQGKNLFIETRINDF